MMNPLNGQKEGPNNEDLDDRVRNRWLESVPTASLDAAGDRVWKAIRKELESTAENVDADRVPCIGPKKSSSFPLKMEIRYRDLIAFAGSACLITSSLMVYVAVKQRRDGIVVSRVKPVERVISTNEFAVRNTEWLPEEEMIWRSLSEHRSLGDGNQSVIQSGGWNSLSSR